MFKWKSKILKKKKAKSRKFSPKCWILSTVAGHPFQIFSDMFFCITGARKIKTTLPRLLYSWMWIRFHLGDVEGRSLEEILFLVCCCCQAGKQKLECCLLVSRRGVTGSGYSAVTASWLWISASCEPLKSVVSCGPKFYSSNCYNKCQNPCIRSLSVQNT